MGVSIERCTERASHAPKSRRTVDSVDNRAEVRKFQISRRAKVTPQQAGVADIGDVRYVVRRLAAFTNVWWSLANEYDFIWTKDLDDWERIAAVVPGACQMACVSA